MAWLCHRDVIVCFLQTVSALQLRLKIEAKKTMADVMLLVWWRSRCRSRRRSFERELRAREVARIGLGSHFDLVAGDGAGVRDRDAVERNGEGEAAAINLAVIDGQGVALGTLNGSSELGAVLLKDEGEREAVAVGRLHLGGPCAGHVGCGEG